MRSLEEQQPNLTLKKPPDPSSRAFKAEQLNHVRSKTNEIVTYEISENHIGVVNEMDPKTTSNE